MIECVSRLQGLSEAPNHTHWASTLVITSDTVVKTSPKMPVRVDSCFDCDLLAELSDISDMADTCLSPCEDIWHHFDDFVLTPPQSPPIRLDLVSDLLDFSSDSLPMSDLSVVHTADVLHDCMWSGQCVEDNNACIAHQTCGAGGHTGRLCGRTRPDTPFTALSTSPFAMNHTFNDLLSPMSDTSSNDDMDDSRSSMDEDFNSCTDSSQSSSSSTSFASKVKESLMNDHSYGGSLVHTISHPNSKSKTAYETQSLIHPKHKVQTRSGNKIKCHKINGKKIKIIKANSPMSCNSIVNTKETTDRSLAVPTVRIIRNDKHFIKSAKSCLQTTSSCAKDTKESQQKSCKFSTRRKASNVSSERKVMFAQNNLFLKSKANERLSQSDEEEEEEEEEVDSNGDTLSPKVPPMRRREHNDSERKRRDHLRNSFVNLKDQIPKLKMADKRPPRIMILHEATAYVHQLNDKQRYLERTLNAEIEKRDKLLKILSNEIKTEPK
ncbi:unnamed protein product [Medioppia subpectinata]|uniref:BHLH domain-containing protein n=1 Tax=Medioppia subpectinata TaxID=1979941 RepID=A0A7R9PTJ7_9ACAR|nr:unnamed protein product [Medioppia subpectinata]CAG2100220.1 unnamed protein product [Medioppia subpectinata]